LVRIVGVNLPKEKRFLVALTSVYGIGIESAKNMCLKLEIDLNLKTYQVSEDKISKLRSLIDKEGILLEGDLRRKISSDIKRLTDISCYRGIRHVKKLPVRGQRTHTNAKTRKGKSVAIAGKKKVVK
jgi:small subunit ribosomal protein S13